MLHLLSLLFLLQWRLLEGFSMGGYGAARLGLTYYDRFAGFSMLGAGPLQLDFVNYPHARTSPEQRQQIFDEVYGGDQKYFEAMSPWRIAGNHYPLSGC